MFMKKLPPPPQCPQRTNEAPGPPADKQPQSNGLADAFHCADKANNKPNFINLNHHISCTMEQSTQKLFDGIDTANLKPCQAPADSIEDKGIFIAKTAKQWCEDAAKRPNPKQLWKSLWHENEVACLFGDTNCGKSILALQIAEDVCRDGHKVLYIDCEMSSKQVQRRYTNEETGKVYTFSSNLYRAELNPEAIIGDDIAVVIDEIERHAKKVGADVLIVDNLTWLSSGTEKGDVAAELMSEFIKMKKRSGLSCMFLAHTPKRNIKAPLTQNSLAGSKRLANFVDSLFAIGFSKKDKPGGRYIKQIKVRSCEMEYGEDNVIEAQLVKEDDFLHFKITGYGTEAENLEEPDAQDIIRNECDAEIARRLGLKQPYVKIISALHVSPKRISRISKALSELKKQSQN